MDLIEVVRTLEGFRLDAKQAKEMDLFETLQDCLELLADHHELKVCCGCKRYFARNGEDACESCLVAADHQRASDDEDYNNSRG